MTRAQLEHVIRAACRIASTTKIYIFGSQSILGQYPDFFAMYSGDGADFSVAVRKAHDLMRSAEADILVPGSEEKTDAIEGAIGEQSAFHHTHGYYAQGIDLTTCTLPAGWDQRLVEIRVDDSQGPFFGYCLDVHDMVLSKLYAARPKDLDFARNAASLGIVDEQTLLGRLADMPIPQDRKDWIRTALAGVFRHER